MATWTASQDNSSYGNVNMRIWLGYGNISRSGKSVSFNFGVRFRPLNAWTSNSIAAWYDGVQRFAFANPGISGYNDSRYRALVNTDYYAQFSDRNTLHKGTSESLCYTYSNNNVDYNTTSIDISVGVGWMDWGGAKKGSLTFSVPIPKGHSSAGGASISSIVDNGNNTVTINTAFGTDGDNNAVSDVHLYYSYTNSNPTVGAWGTAGMSAGTISGRTKAFTLSFDSDKTIYARAYSISQLGDNPGGSVKSATLKYYTAPGDPGKPIISYTKSRLTIKEPWTISWDAAQAGNSNSPISGYRLIIYKNGLPIDIKNSSGTVVSATVGAYKYYDMSGTSYVINPSSHGILPGDNISIALFAYAINGAGTRLWSGNEENAVISDVYTVQNAGVMRPLVNNKYVEGVVWACIPDSTTDSKIKWVEADIVKTAIKDSSTNSIKWVEGE